MGTIDEENSYKSSIRTNGYDDRLTDENSLLYVAGSNNYDKDVWNYNTKEISRKINDLKTGILIADNAIKTRKIANNAIITSKIADDAITTDKIEDNAINGTTIPFKTLEITNSKTLMSSRDFNDAQNWLVNAGWDNTIIRLDTSNSFSINLRGDGRHWNAHMTIQYPGPEAIKFKNNSMTLVILGCIDQTTLTDKNILDCTYGLVDITTNGLGRNFKRAQIVPNNFIAQQTGWYNIEPIIKVFPVLRHDEYGKPNGLMICGCLHTFYEGGYFPPGWNTHFTASWLSSGDPNKKTYE